jgi:hypothetical protein
VTFVAKAITPPFHPTIYVRGYAMTPGEIAATVAEPYMGFNLGSTKVRQTWDGKVSRHIFESPLVRLMKEYDYRDIYANGTEIVGRIPSRSLVIYRYYEIADTDLGTGKALSIKEAAKGLRELIHSIREQVCGDEKPSRESFRVHLVAHSMGGLVCRCLLQNDDIRTAEDRRMVGRVFTYATPHNGIETLGFNVPSVLELWDINNFNRKEMAKYLGLPPKSDRVDSLAGKFDPDRFFCFVGTNHRDYEVALGIARRLANEMSDGLVRIENATVQGSPRSFAFRSHSGPYGVVNSEEGYQNLVRFLFGDVRVDGILDVHQLPLPPTVQKAHDKGTKIRASYYLEATVAPRGAFTFRLSERRRDTFCAMLRKFDELVPSKNSKDKPHSPVLFSAFLDSSRITSGNSIVFSVDLAVSTTGYEIDDVLFLKKHIEGEYLYRNTLAVKATRNRDQWSIRYALTDKEWSEEAGTLAVQTDEGFVIPITSEKGFRADLRLRVSKQTAD